MENARLLDDLIVVSYRRPAELETCLRSVAAQTHIPSTVNVIEGRSPLARGVASELRDQLGDRLRYELMDPSLTRQRNVGVQLTSGQIVHFIDDDVILERDYFEKILDTFLADECNEIGGVGGLITNLPDQNSSFIRRLFLLDGPQGRLLPSGKNVLVFETEVVREVDWLTGCSMSFRRSVFETELFDESDLRSLGFGDDVDFSTRVARNCRLVITPLARLEHRQSSVGRLRASEIIRGELSHRHHLAKERRGVVRTRWFWLSVLGEIVLLCGQALRTWSVEPLGTAVHVLRGARSVLRSSRLAEV